MGKWSKVLIVTAFVIVLTAVAAAAVNVKNPRDVSFAGIPVGDAPETMPEIVFVFCGYRCNSSHLEWYRGPIKQLYYTAIIDAKGDVYYSYNRLIGEMCSFEKDGIRQLYEKYESGELLPLMLKLGDIDTEELQNSYRMLEEVRNNPEFALYESETEAYSPLEGWEHMAEYPWRIECCYGICYDREGNSTFLLLMDKGERYGTISTDKRANELVEWVRSVIDYGSKVEKRLWAHDL